MNLYKMFDEAKRRCFDRLRDFTCARIPLPWAAAMTDEIAAAYGPDPFPYGVEPSLADHRGVLPLLPRTGRDPSPDDAGRSVPARGARDGEGVIFRRAWQPQP